MTTCLCDALISSVLRYVGQTKDPDSIPHCSFCPDWENNRMRHSWHLDRGHGGGNKQGCGCDGAGHIVGAGQRRWEHQPEENPDHFS